MRSVGVRELKERTSEVLRWVREGREEIEVTYHGRAIARLLPVPESAPEVGELAAVWSDLDRVAAEIGARWPGGVGAADSVAEGRREL